MTAQGLFFKDFSEKELYLNVVEKSFISLINTNSYIFLFAFIWNMTLMRILVCNLECYECFRRVFVEVYVFL